MTRHNIGYLGLLLTLISIIGGIISHGEAIFGVFGLIGIILIFVATILISIHDYKNKYKGGLNEQK